MWPNMLHESRFGAKWLSEVCESITDTVKIQTPSEFSEEHRYIPSSVSRLSGYMRFSVNPFMREIVDCFDIDSDVREVSVKKGVQVTATTALESGLFYIIACVRHAPCIFVTADKELATIRVENNILPMLNQSGFGHVVEANDLDNPRKTGKNSTQIQWSGGGYLIPLGAKNANKFRSIAARYVLKDEVDGWPDVVGKDGDPMKLIDDRASSFWDVRKIYNVSTPLLSMNSKIQAAYLRGDQRKYFVRCRRCNHAQEITEDGFTWETENGILLIDSVAWKCAECKNPHYEHDKAKLLATEEGAEWRPTANAQQGCRSYHIPAWYSPAGLQPWHKCVAMYLQAFDEKGEELSSELAQVYVNNVRGEPYDLDIGARVSFEAASAHRRLWYKMGEVPNIIAQQHSETPILMLTCQVDVHKHFLAVSVLGWCRDFRVYQIDYFRFQALGEWDSCQHKESTTWTKLRELIDEKEYVADDGRKYRIVFTVIDSKYATDTVVSFCSDYATTVYPIGGSPNISTSRIREFQEYRTRTGQLAFSIYVDSFKDRLAISLRKTWNESSGDLQPPFCYNAPLDFPDSALKELTVEERREKVDLVRGTKKPYWYRPDGSRNELWDLLVYGHAAVHIVAWQLVAQFGLDTVDWIHFWDYLCEGVYYEGPHVRVEGRDGD